MKKIKNQTRLDEPKVSAIAVLILCFWEKMKKVKDFHLSPLETEVRDEDGNILFFDESKTLVKRLYLFCKSTFSLTREEVTKAIVENIPSKIKNINNKRYLLISLIKNIEKEYPQPWRVGSHYDRIIDSTGRVFCYLSEPQHGLTFTDLKNLISVRQRITEPKSSSPLGQFVF